MNFRTISSGDCVPARYIPFALLSEGTPDLESLAHVVLPDPNGYWATRTSAGLVSRYPILTPLLVTPLYLPVVPFLPSVIASPARLLVLAEAYEKAAASFLAALSVALFYVLARRRLVRSRAILLAVAFALGTTTWTISSQALWQHGTAQLFIVGALLGLTSSAPRLGSAILGLCAGLAFAARAANAPLSAGLVVAGALAHGWSFGLRSIAFAALPGSAVVLYNLVLFGSFFGGYSSFDGSLGQFFSTSPVTLGIWGLLASPGRGLLLFSPFLLLLADRSLTDSGKVAELRVRAALLAGCALQYLMYARTDWRAGWGYGPRFLTDMLPILCWLLAELAARWSPLRWKVFAALAVVSVSIHAAGAFYYRPEQDARFFGAAGGPFAPELWSITSHPALVALRSGRAPMGFGPIPPPELLEDGFESGNLREWDGRRP